MTEPQAQAQTDIAADVGVPTTPADNEDARSIAGSEKSTASSRSGIPKFGGSRIATLAKSSSNASNISNVSTTSNTSKIGRLCAGQTKAPLPATTPPKNLIEMDEFEEDFFGNRLHNYTSTLPKSFKSSYQSPFENMQDYFKDDLFKDYSSGYNSYNSSYNSYSKPPKGLSRERSNSRERCRERSPSLRRTSLGSTGTASSMDALWDLHPRRLSEAGLSRYSDNNTVLTEDTNSFIIGQRVFVGGTKPGQIAYIGETQFAPGEWAGIVLDQPIGKNDGSVGGIRYFQCESKKGVFSRLTRLTRYPLGPDGAGGDAYCTSPSPTNGMRKSQISPTTSTRSALSISNTSLASAHVDFKIGDRVIIKSSQGSKVGTLRYMGFTAFANGEWCGVELDEPRGKNDGSVNGERYFDCRPNYGLFAPVSKVSKSPSNRKPGNCVVHSSSMRRSNSKESLLSMNSSMASTSTRRRSTQTPPKGNSTPLPSRTALQDVLKEKQQHIEQLLKERDLERAEITKAASLADEAEQKYVTLQKDFENYRIDNERKLKDIHIKLAQTENDNKELVVQLEEERAKNEDWQFKFEEAAITKADVESTNEEYVAKIAELELQISQFQAQIDVESSKLILVRNELDLVKEENAAIKVELEHANEKRSSLEYEETKSIELVQTLQSQVDEANSALKQHQEMSAKQIEDLNKQISKLNAEHEVENFKLNQEIEEVRAKYINDINAKNDELKLITCNYEEAKTILENTIKDHEKYRYEADVNEQATKKELDKLKMEMSAKILELETQHELAKTQTENIKKLEEALAKTQKDLESQIKETENVNMEEEKSMIEVEKLKTQLDETNVCIAKLKEQLEIKEETSKKEVEAANDKVIKLNEQFNHVKGELVAITQELQGSLSKFQTNEEELARSYQQLEKGKMEYMQIQEKLQQELQVIEQAKIKESQLVLELGDAKRNALQNEEKLVEADKIRQKLEAEIQQLLGASGEESSKLEILNKELQSKQSELQQNKEQFETRIKELEHMLQEVNIKFNNTVEKGTAEKTEFEKVNANLKAELAEANENSQKTIDNLNKAINDLKNNLNTNQLNVHEKDQTLEQLQQELNNEMQAKNSLQENLNDITQHNQSVQQKLEETLSEIAQLKETLAQSNEQLHNSNKNLEVQSSHSEEVFAQLKNNFDEERDNLQAQLSEKDKSVQELLARIEEIEKQNSQKDAFATEKDLEIETLKQTQLDTKKHAEELRVDNQNNKQLLENAHQELAKLNEKYHDLVSKLQEKEHELQEAHKGEATILEKNNKISSLESKHIELGKTIESITNQLEASKATEIKIQKELEDKTQQVHNLENAITSKEKESSDVNSNLVKSKNDEIAKLQINLQEVTTTMQKMEQVNNDLKKQLENLEGSKASIVGDLQTLNNQHVLFEKLLKSMKVSEDHKNELLKSNEVKNNEMLRALVSSLNIQIINDNKNKVQELEQLINTNNESLVAANNLVKKQGNEIMLLHQELLKMKMDAEKKPTNVPILTDEAVNNNNATYSNDYKQLLEEKIEAESQIEFLRSIIADMQKKNEDQKARIEILESGYSPAAADELNLMGGLMEKKVAPRMYCDICEEFDLHETEDCPTQADEDMPALRPPGTKKEKPPPRPYCEICEVFGHSTDDCTEDETY